MSFGTLKHGDTRNRKIKTGSFEHIQPEIYCVLHGWLPLFVTGGEEGFQAKHVHCDRKPKNGAEFEKEKALAAAV
jgi:hypothetical protein